MRRRSDKDSSGDSLNASRWISSKGMGQGRFSQSTFSGSAFSSCFRGSATARPTEEGDGEGGGGGGAAAWLTEDPIGEKATEQTPFCYPSACVRALERGKGLGLGLGLGLRLRLRERFWEGFLSAPVCATASITQSWRLVL
ncbi:hypothetical protein GW17_00057576 [Ensete ventricosum]|nr:hypothetical protein GW17_00057576 [Ensete ventricosum]